MIIQTLQHVPFESPGYILDICQRSGYRIKNTNLYKNEDFPGMDSFDVLVIMGGPMSIHDEDDYRWLRDEKRFIREAIDRGKTVFGFCLGAQLIASALGAAVTPGEHSEIGWYPVIKNPDNDKLAFLNDVITVFHWHGDTFSLPDGATLLYSSDATPNQAFIYGDHVVALQFHPEMTLQGITGLVSHCRNELVEGPFIMSEDELTGGHVKYHSNGYKMVESLFRHYVSKLEKQERI